MKRLRFLLPTALLLTSLLLTLLTGCVAREAPTPTDAIVPEGVTSENCRLISFSETQRVWVMDDIYRGGYQLHEGVWEFGGIPFGFLRQEVVDHEGYEEYCLRYDLSVDGAGLSERYAILAHAERGLSYTIQKPADVQMDGDTAYVWLRRRSGMSGITGTGYSQLVLVVPENAKTVEVIPAYEPREAVELFGAEDTALTVQENGLLRISGWVGSLYQEEAGSVVCLCDHGEWIAVLVSDTSAPDGTELSAPAVCGVEPCVRVLLEDCEQGSGPCPFAGDITRWYQAAKLTVLEP